ncbi:hypothetical protein C2G38_2036015 [Gigaspora rosea]|uniref:Uncharacterized protein n=1 Tax=Gigaspora rosea TaxID=44941 RepID=A0A397VCM9_9GLOM|nr:hypothetical protein C2G38_2036015 [Gigaspora rosea]
MTKVVDAYYDTVKPVEKVIYLGVDLPCIRAPAVISRSYALKPDTITSEIHPARPLRKSTFLTKALELYYGPEMLRENNIENLSSKDPKQDDNKLDLEIILENLVSGYLEVLRNWIPKLVGLDE